jgi:PAS domain S-box-containing protein
MSAKRLIVMDDEEGIQEALTEMLTLNGYQVDCAGSGEEGIEMISNDFYNVAIVDLRLQDMTGIEIMERIEEVSPDTEVIIMTAYASVDSAIRAVKGRAFDYMLKPFKSERLLDTVEGALNYQDLKVKNKNMLRQLAFLNEISNDMVKTFKIDTILELVLERTLEFFSIRSGAIYIQEKGDWILRKDRGVTERFRSDYFRLAADHAIVKEATDNHFAVLKKTNSNKGGAMWAAVPFPFGDSIMGILVLAGKGSELLDEEDGRLLTIMGAQVGTILYNAMTFEQIESTRSYLQNLVENTADAIITYDLNGKIVDWNPAASGLYGYDSKEAIGKFLITVPDDRKGESKGMFDEIRRGGTVSNFETVRRTKEGRFLDVAVTLSPLKDASGQLMGYSCISRDLTSKKEMDRERVRSEILEARNKIRDVLIDVVPLLLKRNFPQEDKNEFILTLSRKLEEVLYDDYVGPGDTSPEDIARSIVAVLNDMGGDFSYMIDEEMIAISGHRCPWRNDQRRNPVICMLTRSISARFAKRALGDVRVTLESTLANKDECCRISIVGFSTLNGSQSDPRESTRSLPSDLASPNAVG